MDELNLQACASQKIEFGALVALDIDDQGRKIVRKASAISLDKIILGFAARDLKSGETVEYSFTHNTKDILMTLKVSGFSFNR